MGRIRQFRDPKLSIWLSSVDEVVRRKRRAHGTATGLRAAVPAPARPDDDDPIIDAATELSARLEAGELPRVSPGMPAIGLGDAVLYCARLAMNLAEAKIAGRAADAERYQKELDADFGQCDPDWIQVAEQYAKNLILHFGEVPYRRHSSLSDFVIDGKLPDTARVAVIADWGTGDAAARRVLSQVAAKKPDVLIHLGDIYYSGTPMEVEEYFLGPLREKFDPARTPCFSLSGNHDMYSGGHAYYGDLLPALGQPASYFCLRNDHWQFVAIDTGLHDRIPGGGSTFLEDSELAWLADKVENSEGRQTILLSHHQLFSAFEKIQDTYCNERLHQQVAPLLDKIALWLWGHEHRFTIYEEFDALTPGLKRGRCVGFGAFPVGLDEEPAGPLFPQVRFDANATLGHDSAFYNHGYAIVELDGAAAHVSYFQDTDETKALFEETVSSTAAARTAK